MIRVLIVDDSSVVRQALRQALSPYRDVEVVGVAADAFEARDLIAERHPDVLTLDIEMPRMDGLSFLRHLMAHHPLPVVVLSSIAPENSDTALLALQLGAVDVVGKPTHEFATGRFQRALVQSIRAAASARLRPAGAEARGPAVMAVRRSAPLDLIAIGASTGGTRAIEAVLRRLHADAPPCLIAQHLPAAFTPSFAARLAAQCPMDVRPARDGDRLRPGLALVAPGDHHMLVRRVGSGYVIRLVDGPRVHHHRPSVDVLFDSVASAAGDRAAGVLLTGMGADGAQGLLRIRRTGGFTLAESEETCVVFGMPRQAIAMDAAVCVAPLHQIAPILLGASGPSHRRVGAAGAGPVAP